MGVARRYNKTLKSLTKKYLSLRARASTMRKKAITSNSLKSKSKRTKRQRASNRSHPEDTLKFDFDENDFFSQLNPKAVQESQEIAKTSNGRKALSKYNEFIGFPVPVSVKKFKTPGKNKYLIGMGRSPVVLIADGPDKRSSKKIRKIKGRWTPAFDASGKRIVILKPRAGKNFGKGLKFIGWVPETHYIMTSKMEKAGSFKKGKYWVHEHDDDGGSWPKAYQDKEGNILYAKGTYHIDDWIRQ